MTDITANLGLPVIAAAQAQKHVTHNEALRLIDTLVQLAVLDRDLAAPPATPGEGERWIVGAGATGAWAGHADDIAAWQDGAWWFSTPRSGWIAFVADEGTLLAWNGSAWGDLFAAVTSIQNLARLGVGAAADAANPFSARLNNALWAARTVADGGDGDLRTKMSKESASDALSLLMQTNFSGRAEIGLAGDDNLSVKVSADGSAWKTALVADRTSGAVSMPYTLPGAWGLILPQTRALVAAMTTEPRRARTLLIDTLIASLIDAGVWAKLDALYLFAAHDSQAALLNWKNPAGVVAAAVNSPAFTADRGFTGDGASAYIDTGIRLDTLGGNFSQDSAMLAVWSLTDVANGGFSVGTGALAKIAPRSVGGNMSTSLNAAAGGSVAVADSLGLFLVSRGSGAGYARYKNTTSLGDASVSSTGMDATNLTALGVPASASFTTRQIAMIAAGGHMNGPEQVEFYNAIYDYLHDGTVGAA
jgi:hypothetical protein